MPVTLDKISYTNIEFLRLYCSHTPSEIFDTELVSNVIIMLYYVICYKVYINWLSRLTIISTDLCDFFTIVTFITNIINIIIVIIINIDIDNNNNNNNNNDNNTNNNKNNTNNNNNNNNKVIIIK